MSPPDARPPSGGSKNWTLEQLLRENYITSSPPKVEGGVKSSNVNHAASATALHRSSPSSSEGSSSRCRSRNPACKFPEYVFFDLFSQAAEVSGSSDGDSEKGGGGGRSNAASPGTAGPDPSNHIRTKRRGSFADYRESAREEEEAFGRTGSSPHGRELVALHEVSNIRIQFFHSSPNSTSTDMNLRMIMKIETLLSQTTREDVDEDDAAYLNPFSVAGGTSPVVAFTLEERELLQSVYERKSRAVADLSAQLIDSQYIREMTDILMTRGRVKPSFEFMERVNASMTRMSVAVMSGFLDVVPIPPRAKEILLAENMAFGSLIGAAHFSYGTGANTFAEQSKRCGVSTR